MKRKVEKERKKDAGDRKYSDSITYTPAYDKTM